jgi:aspartyl-tRNA(Asn)/glutamyl-tRNA(Gln) amidotransferase subunit A
MASDLGALRLALDSREVTSVELTTRAIERLARQGSSLNAVACLTPERALDVARVADARIDSGESRPLLGIPYAVKDVFDVVGTPTTCGSPALAQATAAGDSKSVRLLEAAGAVLVGKLALNELIGYLTHDPSASLHGPARNPWNTSYWAGGSSGGSGASVCAGLVPFSLATEAAGSIGSPSAWCGVTGLRPTHGLINDPGVVCLSPTLDKIGVIGRSVEDCEIVLRALTQASYEWRRHPLWNTRIGLARSDFDEDAPPELRASYGSFLETLQATGVKLVDRSLPTELPYRETLDVILQHEGAHSFAFMRESDRLDLILDADAREAIRSAASDSGAYSDALASRDEIEQALEEMFLEVDVLVTTNFALPRPIPRIDERWKPIPILRGNTAMVWASNLAGLPAVFLPCDPGSDGMPAGVQIIGRAGADADVLRIGVELQQALSVLQGTAPFYP